MKYRKKPVVIEAFQFGVNCWPDWFQAASKRGDLVFPEADDHKLDGIDIKTLEGVMHASNGDYIIQGVKGEIYPCKPDIFSATYDPVGGEGGWG